MLLLVGAAACAVANAADFKRYDLEHHYYLQEFLDYLETRASTSRS